jgi:phosphoribosylformimino-5-aminoimidazole carboxamide ribotide isomerase
MDFYPAIDIRGGRCVRLHQGDYEQETVYGDDPVAVAKAYEAAGAPWIHVVDLDAARGQGSNRELVVAVAQSVAVPVQTGGGVSDASLLQDGVSCVVLGSMVMRDRAGAAALIAANPGRVAVGLDHRDGELRVHGWQEGSGVPLLEAVAWPELAEAVVFIVTNIARDATMSGPDLEGLEAVMAASSVPVVASGGVGSLDDLEALRYLGAYGVIVGKALYEGRFTVEEAIAVCAPSG